MVVARRLLMGGGGSFAPLPEQGRWSARSVVLTATEAWEGLGILEPSVMYESGTFKMWYRGGGLHGPDTAVGYATSSDGISWTKYAGNPIYGNGVAGEAGDIIAPFVYKEQSSGTYILYYSRTTDNSLRAATSMDGITFTPWDTLMALPTGATAWGNTTVWKEGTTWHGYFEAFLSGPAYWATWYATSSNGANWTLGNGGNELSTLQVAAGGTYSVPNFWPDDPKIGGGLYQGWYHANPSAGNGPSDIYRAYSSDKITWTQVSPAPILTHSGTGFEVDQLADPGILQVGGTSYMYVDADDNATDIAAIELVTFGGTLAQLVAGT